MMGIHGGSGINPFPLNTAPRSIAYQLPKGNLFLFGWMHIESGEVEKTNTPEIMMPRKVYFEGAMNFFSFSISKNEIIVNSPLTEAHSGQLTFCFL